MPDLIRTKWAAVGAAVAVTLGAGGLSLTQAAISSGPKPVYVALEAPCRLVDTRPAPNNVGPKNTPIAAGETNAYEIQVTGANGDCTGPLAIPADAVAVALNVTAINPNAPSGRSFFTVYPADAELPVTSNLNIVNGQAPTPNKVDVGLSATGRIKIYNADGTANAAVDVFGYYIDHHHDDRYYTKAEVNAALDDKAAAVQQIGLSARHFRPVEPGTEWNLSFGWQHDPSVGEECLVATIDIPSGSEVTAVTLTYDVPGPGTTVDAFVAATRLTPGPFSGFPDLIDYIVIQNDLPLPPNAAATIGGLSLPLTPHTVQPDESLFATICTNDEMTLWSLLVDID
jgi:hypothetical protein